MRIFKNSILVFYILICNLSFGQDNNCSKVSVKSVDACLGQVLTLNANTTNLNDSVSITWTTPNGRVFNGKELLLRDINTEDEGVYSIIAKFGNGCKNIDSSYTYLRVIKETFYSFESTHPFCEGNNVNLPYISAKPIFDLSKNQVSYSWTGPNNYLNTELTPTIANFTKAKSGFYTLEVTVSGTCNLKTKKRVYLEPVEKMEVGIQAYLSNICYGDKIQFEARTLNSYSVHNTFEWKGPNNFKSNKPYGEIAKFEKIHEGLYTVTVKTEGCKEVAVAKKEIRIQKPFKPINIGTYNGNQFCKGSSFEIYANQISSIFGEITWEGPNKFSAKGGVISISDFDSKNEGIYYVKARSSSCSEVFVDSISLSIIKTPKLYSENIDSVFFCGNSITLYPPYTIPNYTPNPGPFANLPNGKIDYEWNGPNGSKSNSERFTLMNFSNNYEGEYNLKMTYSNGCEGVVLKKYFLKQRLPSINWSANKLCTGDIYISPNIELGSSYYSPYSFKIYDENLKTVTNPIPKESTGIYSIETDFKGACNYKDYQKIDLGKAIPFGLSLPKSMERCVGSYANFKPIFAGAFFGGFSNEFFDVTNLVNGATRLYLSWDSPNGNNLRASGSLSNITKNDEGVYKITGKLMGECTGIFSAESKLIVDEQRPLVAFDYRFENENLILKNETKGRVSNYNWNIGDFYQSKLENPLPISIKSGSPDPFYKITLEAVNSCGSSKTAKDLNFNSRVLSNEINENDVEIDFFPNPTHSEIYLKNNHFSDIKIDVISSEGKQLKTITTKKYETLRIDLKGFNSGVYYFKYLSQDGNINTKRIILYN